ncbi:MAG: site-2 protease family protein [Planctomycetota bacterium]
MILQEPPPNNFDLKFTLFRVPVRVHPGFWLICVLMNLDNRINPIALALSIGVVFVSILVHEFGHALSSRFFGERHNRVILYTMGGLCVHEGMVARQGKRIWTILWGPLAGFLLGGMVFGVGVGLVASGIVMPKMALGILFQAVFINVVWGVVNLIPVFPLDGGQIVQEVVRWKFPRKGDEFVCTVSIWVGASVALILLAAHFASLLTGLFGPLLFGLLAYQNYSLRKQIRAMGAYYGREEDEPRQPWERDADWWKKN